MLTEKSISQLIDLADDSSEITDYYEENGVKHLTIKKKLIPPICPLCGTKMHSKGLYTRNPKHQILQSRCVLKVKLIGRNWECPNAGCSHTQVDQFSFIEPNKQVTKLIPLAILDALKDINLSARQVAEKFNVSDTYVHQVFLRYVDMKRKPLTECISIDEVYLNFAYDCKYALVIMDFKTGEILDIVKSRRKEYTESYFLSIPKEERDKVKYLICDMYNPYINYTKNYFLHSSAITDSFHVIQWLLKLINRHINDVKKRYQERDRLTLEEKNKTSNNPAESHPDSDEVYILKKASWVLLKNRSNWKFKEKQYNKKLKRYMDTYDWESSFIAMDDQFNEIQLLKDLYEDFNENYMNDLDGAAERLNELIEIYKACSIKIFNDFARLLKTYSKTIINSFIYIQCERVHDPAILSRLSNGPMESFNNIPSSLRSQSHGVTDFEYTRGRILWAVRKDATINLVPKSKSKIKHHGTERGPYKKKKK